jgi:hypothetical protein
MSSYSVQTVECQGIPRIEYRYEPEIPSEIRIEFTPRFPYDDFAYEDPRLVFAQQVLLMREFEPCQSNNLNWRDECEVYRICALELAGQTHLNSEKLSG